MLPRLPCCQHLSLAEQQQPLWLQTTEKPVLVCSLCICACCTPGRSNVCCCSQKVQITASNVRKAAALYEGCSDCMTCSHSHHTPTAATAAAAAPSTLPLNWCLHTHPYGPGLLNLAHLGPSSGPSGAPAIWPVNFLALWPIQAPWSDPLPLPLLLVSVQLLVPLSSCWLLPLPFKRTLFSNCCSGGGLSCWSRHVSSAASSAQSSGPAGAACATLLDACKARLCAGSLTGPPSVTSPAACRVGCVSGPCSLGKAAVPCVLLPASFASKARALAQACRD
jgi:hypothetical protein